MSARRSSQPARLALAAALAAVAAGAGAGCGPTFDPYNRLEALRVLAIRSEIVAPAPGETADLSALVYTPPGQPAPSYAWSWCPLIGLSTSGYPCLVTDAQLEPLTGQPNSLELGTDPTASLFNDPVLIGDICNGGMQGGLPPPDCSSGFPVTIILTVQTQDQQQTIKAIQPLTLRTTADQPGNANPTISEPFAVIGGANQDLDLVGTPVLPRRTETPIGVMVPDDASETYMGTDENDNPAVVREQLVLTWFVESGDTKSQNTTFIDGVTLLSDAEMNQWTPDVKKNYQPDTAELIVVIRDGRNGVAWTSGFASLEMTP